MPEKIDNIRHFADYGQISHQRGINMLNFQKKTFFYKILID
jgi:hypothetical protein